MKTITIVAIIAAVVVVGGACAGVAFSGVLNGGTTGPGGDDPVVPTEPVEPTPTETPTETPTQTPTDSSMSYFSPMTSSGSGSSKPSHVHTYSEEWSKNETDHWHIATCSHDLKKDEATHTIENVEAKPATCTDTGYEAGERCSICGYVKSGLGEIPVIAHTEVIDAAKDATCTETGLTEGKHCSVCNTVLVAQTVVAAKGHTYAEAWENDDTHHWHVATCGHDEEKGEYSEHEYTNIKDGEQVCVCGHTTTANVEVGTAADLAAIIEAAFSNGGTGDVTVTLTQDIDVASSWTTFAVPNTAANIVIDGAGYTISNLNKPLVTGLWGGYGTLTFKNLTINKANINGYNAVTDAGGTVNSCGAFMAYADAATGIVFENCNLTNSIVSSNAEYVGGFVGYASSPITFTKCSATGNTISGYKSTGTILGHLGSDSATVSSATVTGNSITGNTKQREWGVGAIFGRSSSGCNVEMTYITISSNTITQPGATDSKTSDYYGKSYGTTTLDGNTI